MSIKYQFILDDNSIESDYQKVKHLFPQDLLEKLKPHVIKAIQNTEGWNVSVFKIHTNGTFEVEENVPNDIIGTI